jgi:hypothetical protein
MKKRLFTLLLVFAVFPAWASSVFQFSIFIANPKYVPLVSTSTDGRQLTVIFPDQTLNVIISRYQITQFKRQYASVQPYLQSFFCS